MSTGAHLHDHPFPNSYHPSNWPIDALAYASRTGEDGVLVSRKGGSNQKRARSKEDDDDEEKAASGPMMILIGALAIVFGVRQKNRIDAEVAEIKSMEKKVRLCNPCGGGITTNHDTIDSLSPSSLLPTPSKGLHHCETEGNG